MFVIRICPRKPHELYSVSTVKSKGQGGQIKLVELQNKVTSSYYKVDSIFVWDERFLNKVDKTPWEILLQFV